MHALLGLMIALVSLAGCSIEGRVQVTSVSSMDVDVTVRGDRSPYCNGDIPGLSVVVGSEPGGVVSSCRYLGTVDPTGLDFVLGLASAGEYLVLVMNPFHVSELGLSEAAATEVERIDITFVMPGTVVERNGGTPNGPELRITDLKAFQVPGGLRVVSLNHTGPPWWQWWTAAGLLAGLLIGLIIVGAGRLATRQRTIASDASDASDAGSLASAGPNDQPEPTLTPTTRSGQAGTPPLHPGPPDRSVAGPQPAARSRPDPAGEGPSADPRRSDPARWAPED